jgi:hypothetical protein
MMKNIDVFFWLGIIFVHILNLFDCIDTVHYYEPHEQSGEFSSSIGCCFESDF